MVTKSEKIISLITQASELTGTKLPVPPELDENLPVKVVLLGQPQQNLFGILHDTFGGFDILNRSFLHGYKATVKFASENKVLFCGTESDENKVTETLSKFETTEENIVIQMEMANEAMKNLELTVIASENDFEDVNWLDLFSNADYCFFTLTSTALLSMAERKVLRKWLLPYMNAQLGIILTNDNLILESDRVDIDSTLERFFEGKTEIFRLPEADEKKITSKFLWLIENLPELREANYARISKLCLEKAAEDVDLQIQALSDDAEKLDEAIDILNSKAKSLSGRQESACRKMRLQYTSQLRVSATEQISKFHQKLMEKLHSEINGNENIDTMQNLIPDYIRDQWGNEADRITEMIKSAGEGLQKGLSEFIANDIREYISEGISPNMTDYIIRLTDLYVDKEFVVDENSFRFEETYDNSKLKRYGVIAAGVGLVLMCHPIVGAAVAIFGSKKIKKMEDARLLNTNRQSLIAAADEMCRETYDDMVVWLDNMVTAIEHNIAACVEECYQKMMTTMIKALGNKKDDREKHEEQLVELNAIKNEIQNEIKQRRSIQ